MVERWDGEILHLMGHKQTLSKGTLSLQRRKMEIIFECHTSKFSHDVGFTAG